MLLTTWLLSNSQCGIKQWGIISTKSAPRRPSRNLEDWPLHNVLWCNELMVTLKNTKEVSRAKFTRSFWVRQGSSSGKSCIALKHVLGVLSYFFLQSHCQSIQRTPSFRSIPSWSVSILVSKTGARISLSHAILARPHADHRVEALCTAPFPSMSQHHPDSWGPPYSWLQSLLSEGGHKHAKLQRRSSQGAMQLQQKLQTTPRDSLELR